MPTEIEELVEFLHHGNTQIRQIAAENLVPFSEQDPSIFKVSGNTPIKDLKLLVKDYAPIAKNALTMLVNLSGDQEILNVLWEENAFVETLLSRVTNSKEPNADLLAMLLANMGKDNRVERLLKLERAVPAALSTSSLAMDQMLDVFVRSGEGAFNKSANLDHLAYLFADIARSPSGADYLLTPRSYDDLYPLSKLLPFTDHKSVIRRRGASATTKNAAFAKLDSHMKLMNAPLDVLPFVLRPLASGQDNFKPDEEEQLPDELQYLDDNCQRDQDSLVLKTHLDTLLVLTASRKGRDMMRQKGVYYIVRECHLAVDDDEVREGCDRLVQVLMRDEEGGEAPSAQQLEAGETVISSEEGKDGIAHTEDDDEVVEIAL